MKHVTCGGWIEIRTDPKNTAYVVTEGARKRDTGEDKILEGDIEIRTEEEREKLRNDAFAALEVTIDDRKQTEADKERIEGLWNAKDKNRDDPYAASRKLRRVFRAERKVREQNQERTEALKDKMSIGLDLLEESVEDSRRAAAVEFGGLKDVESATVLRKTHGRSLFSGSAGDAPKAKVKSLSKSEASKARLQQELSENTRATVNPFLSSRSTLVSTPVLPIKRKRSQELETPALSATRGSNLPLLVDYDSDES